MTEPDPNHWLHRFSIAEWLGAADNELKLCLATLMRRAPRPGVTHARRAAGMALNAVLGMHDRPNWGRSYMDHIVAVGQDHALPDAVQAAAQALRETQPAAPPLLQLGGKPDLAAYEAACVIVTWARTVSQPDSLQGAGQKTESSDHES